MVECTWWVAAGPVHDTPDSELDIIKNNRKGRAITRVSTMNDKENLSILGRQNKTAAICQTVEGGILSAAYLLEVVKGSRPLWYVLVTAVLALVPVFLDWFFYKKNPETSNIKHCLGYGFAILYIFLMLTTTNLLTFTYVIPMIVVISLFGDRKYSLSIGIGVVVVNILQVIISMKTGIIVGYNSATIEIQLLAMVLIVAYSVAINAVMEKNQKIQMNSILENQEKTQKLLDVMMDLSHNISDSVNVISGHVDDLEEKTQKTSFAMQEVNSGSTETAEAVQNQLLQTESIRDKVGQVEKTSDAINASTKETREAIRAGKDSVEDLTAQVSGSVESGKMAAEQLGNLENYMEKMNSIVELINGITSQTSMLSLNASIEAARAGEAGRGFAVVASEISNLASQTKDATVNISDLIKNVTGSLDEVVVTIRKIIQEITSENESVQVTADSFDKIEGSAQLIGHEAEELAAVVKELIVANTAIIDSIQTISGISEEVAAHSNDTLQISDENAEVVKELANSAKELEGFSQELESYSK